MKLVMFDIDGTLTETSEVDEAGFVRALRETFDFGAVNTDWATYPWCTDSGILETLFQERLRRSPSRDEVRRFQDRFLSLLNAAAVRQPFNAIAGAKELLSSLTSKAGIAISIASGAWERSARLKLKSAGLDFINHIPGAFADCSFAREAIMEVSLLKAAEFHCQDSFEAVVYVGDGVWDARAAYKLGFPFIGIARDPAKVERLYAEKAVQVFQDYRDREATLAALNEI
jgi:phosphoglycolate phosphatase-like HAD superfamily hydrolase